MTTTGYADLPRSDDWSEGNPTGDVMSGEKDQAIGKIKQAAGDLTDDEDLKAEGKKDEAAGKVKEFVGDAKDKVEELVDKVRDKT